MKTNSITFKILFEYFPMLLIGLGVLISTIIFHVDFIKVLPIFITLFVMLFNSRANRIGFIIGGCNCFFYFISYMLQRLYTSAFSSAFAGIVAIISFFLWKRNSYGKATIFKKLSTRSRVIFAILFIVAWTITAHVVKLQGGNQALLDSFSGLLGFVIPILTMFAFVEDLPLNLTSILISLVMFILLTIQDLTNLPFLLLSIYNLYMGVKRAITWIKLYKEQKQKNLTN